MQCLILYHPCFYSSLSDKKEINVGSSNISTIMVKFVKNGCRNYFLFIYSAFLEKCWQNLPVLQTFLKCCHFFAFYRSVSCKSQYDRELNRKNHGIIRQIYFIDFFILFCFMEFFSRKSMKCHEKHGSLQKKMLVNGFRYLYHLHSCGFKLKEQQRYLRVTFVKLASWFRP